MFQNLVIDNTFAGSILYMDRALEPNRSQGEVRRGVGNIAGTVHKRIRLAMPNKSAKMTIASWSQQTKETSTCRTS